MEHSINYSIINGKLFVAIIDEKILGISNNLENYILAILHFKPKSPEVLVQLSNSCLDDEYFISIVVEVLEKWVLCAAIAAGRPFHKSDLVLVSSLEDQFSMGRTEEIYIDPETNLNNN